MKKLLLAFILLPSILVGGFKEDLEKWASSEGFKITDEKHNHLSNSIKYNIRTEKGSFVASISQGKNGWFITAPSGGLIDSTSIQNSLSPHKQALASLLPIVDQQNTQSTTSHSPSAKEQIPTESDNNNNDDLLREIQSLLASKKNYTIVPSSIDKDRFLIKENGKIILMLDKRKENGKDCMYISNKEGTPLLDPQGEKIYYLTNENALKNILHFLPDDIQPRHSISKATKGALACGGIVATAYIGYKVNQWLKKNTNKKKKSSKKTAIPSK